MSFLSSACPIYREVNVHYDCRFCRNSLTWSSPAEFRNSIQGRHLERFYFNIISNIGKRIEKLKDIIVPLVLIFMGLFHFCLSAAGQRMVNYDEFPETYFDFIRALVYDTAKENYTINAYRLSPDDEIIIDGRLNEGVWKKADHRGGFLEKEPYPLVPMSEKTEFAILYDDENIYVGVWCWDSEPDKIVQELSPRGTTAPDHVMLFFDSYHDHRTGYKLSVSPKGVQVDELRYDDIKRDNNWNGVWYSEGSVDAKGWYAEVKIPFFNFRYSGDVRQTWGFNIMRNISKNASRGQWKPHLPEWDNTTRMSQMGDIENIHDISSGRTLELRPYGVLGTSKTVASGTTNSLNIGGDVRYSPSPNLTADFTLNPDFAQVDADVYEINMTRFPTRFKELRPFFTERINIFNTPLELFYSRRIGARSNILGGAKMTGKLKHGFEFGALGNRTGGSFFSNSKANEEKATYDGSDENDGQFFNLSSNSTWMFTKDFFIRLHVQGIFGTTYLGQKEVNNDYLLSCLLSWEYRPGSFMYLGYNEGRFDEANPFISNRLEFKNRTLIFKISYFFSI